MTGTNFDISAFREAKALADEVRSSNLTIFTDLLFNNSGIGLKWETEHGTIALLDRAQIERETSRWRTGHEPSMRLALPSTFNGAELYDLQTVLACPEHSAHLMAQHVAQALSAVGERSLARQQRGVEIGSLEEALQAEGLL